MQFHLVTSFKERQSKQKRVRSGFCMWNTQIGCGTSAWERHSLGEGGYKSSVHTREYEKEKG